LVLVPAWGTVPAVSVWSLLVAMGELIALVATAVSSLAASLSSKLLMRYGWWMVSSQGLVIYQ